MPAVEEERTSKIPGFSSAFDPISHIGGYQRKCARSGFLPLFKRLREPLRSRLLSLRSNMQRRDFSTPARGCLRSDRDGFAADRNGAERPAYTFIHPLYALRTSF